MKTSKNEKRYVTLPIMEVIQKSNYKRKDDLYCIIDTVYRRQIYFKTELQMNYGFIEIPRASFQKLIPKPEYIKKAIDFLIDNEIILINDYFVRGISAKKYKIKTEFLGNKVAVEIMDKNINQRIKKIKLDKRKIRVKNMEFAKSKYYKSFKIDFNGAIKAIMNKAIEEIKIVCKSINFNLNNNQIKEIIDCKGDYIKNRNIINHLKIGFQLNNILHRLMVHQQQVNVINDGYLFFKRNKTNGRLDTNLTSLPSYLRKFIKSNEKLFNLDIKNSQPYFLYTKLLKEESINSDELELYGKLVLSGTLYEYLAEVFDGVAFEKLYEFEKTIKRKKAKLNLFKIFYSKIGSYIKIKEQFSSKFSTIMEFINQTNSIEYNTLAIQLQERESITVLDVIMVKLQELEIFPFTIHDSFIVTESELPIVKKVVLDSCFELFGVAPQLHEEALFEVEDENEDFENFCMGDLCILE